jgi:hypothetical protein
MVLCDRLLALFEVLQGRLEVLESGAVKLEGFCQSMHDR